MKSGVKPQVLWCPNTHGKANTGWQFPRTVRRQILADCRGLEVLHLFGGRADFGTRLDIDPTVRPDVLGDAWLPPFSRDSFDVVLMDPPYVHFSVSEKNALLRAAAWIARVRVIWFSTIWIWSRRSLPPEAAWLVRVGDNCHIRCLQYFTVDNAIKEPPVERFDRGPAFKYNRWLAQPEGLALFEP